MDKILSNVLNYFRNRKSHLLYPAFIAIVAVVVGLLTQAWIGAVCFIVAIYLAVVIFMPWNKLIKKRSSLFGFVVSAILCAAIFVPLWNNIIAIFPNGTEQQPNKPTVELIPNPNPPQHGGTSVDVAISAEPAHGYDSYINPEIAITNPRDSPPYCHITLEIYLTGGFKFYKLGEIPDNFQVKDGYLYCDNMTVDIKDCPSTWTYSGFKIPVYHMDHNTVPGSENQNVSIETTVRFQR